MKKRCIVLALLLSAGFAAAAWAVPVLTLAPDESGGGGGPRLAWSTEPGIRYELQESTDLQTWITVAGYPTKAEALAQQQALDLAAGPRRFYRVKELDEQPPRIAMQYPPANGFAVGRFADVTAEFDDLSGVDPSSIRLTVGASGPFSVGAPGLTFTNNWLTFDSGDSALGGWGSTVTVSLVVADLLGHSLTNSWSFRLEPEPEVTTNIFVFGSPTAQRAGQRVSGPAVVLARGYSSMPIRADEPAVTWAVHSVGSNSVVLTYTNGPAPEFTVGQLICNLTPATVDEIFYRRVLSISDEPASNRLTLVTEDANLTNFVTRGAVSISDNSTVFEVDSNGVIVRAVSGTLTFPRIGFDLSGTEFGLREDGFEVTVKGVTYSVGSQMKWINVVLPEYSWWLTPRVQAGLEIDVGGIKSFEGIVQGDVDVATVIEADVVLAGAKVETVLFDLPEALEPKTVIYLGQLGPVPVFATLVFDCSLSADAKARAQLEFGVTYRQDHSATFGIAYERATGLEWMNQFQSTSLDFRGEAALTGELSFTLALDPRLEFLVCGAAGLKAAVKPSAGIVTTVPLAGGSFDGKVEADVAFVLGTTGPLFDILNHEEELSLSIWHGEWPLTPTTPLTFKTHPQSKTVAPGDSVSFTCTVDAPSTPNFQWFHEGLLIPGQTGRSLFLSRVTSDHAGTYFVRAKAGTQTADSNHAILTVQAVTPENQDSDGDGIPDVYETGTGVWVSPTNCGTNPDCWDTDGDGLSDGAESNTGVYVSLSDAGTNPNLADTDADGIADKREVDIGRDPNAAPLAPRSYHLIPWPKFASWNAAKVDAETRGGHLATITSQAEWEEIQRQLPGIPGEGCLLGGHQNVAGAEPGGGWEWITGEPWSAWCASQWFPGEPNNQGGSEDYLEMTFLGSWNDIPDGNPNATYYLLEREIEVYGAYLLIPWPKFESWNAAKVDAETRGGHLATITSQAEWEEIQRQLPGIPGEGCLLGGYQNVAGAEPGGGWEWITGEPWSAWCASQWFPGEPNNQGGSEDYLEMTSLGSWNDIPDGNPNAYYYLLEMDVETNGVYLVVDLSAGPTASNYPVSYLSAVPSGGWTDEYKTTKLVLRRIPAGTFVMGSPTNELDHGSNETQHQVVLRKDFYVGVFEITQGQWERVMGTWPSYFTNATHRDARPVEQVSYNTIRGSGVGAGWPTSGDVDADSFIGRLRMRTGMVFDLPTEAQWEYAGRAGMATALNSGKDLSSVNICSNVAEVGRYWYNGGSSYSPGGDTSAGTAKVGTYEPNQWGLYDIHGNVWEWCLDWYGTYPGTVTDPKGMTLGDYRLFRGGDWRHGANHCRIALRNYYYPSSANYETGLRLALALDDQ